MFKLIVKHTKNTRGGLAGCDNRMCTHTQLAEKDKLKIAAQIKTQSCQISAICRRKNKNTAAK